jgi:hypothetical protein
MDLMALKAKTEWWTEKLSPQETIEAWATAATTSVILAVLLEEKIADGSIVVDEKGVIAPKKERGGK